MEKKFNKALYDTEVHMYGLKQMLASPYRSWEGRDNIDRQDMAVILSTVGQTRKFGSLDMLLALTPIFLRRAFKAVVDWLPKDGGEEWNHSESGRMDAVTTLVHLLDEWYTAHDYAPDTPDCPCTVRVWYKEGPSSPDMYFRAEDFVQDLTRKGLWLRTDRIVIERKRDDFHDEISFDTHKEFKVVIKPPKKTEIC